MKIIVTGAAGFIGSHLCEYLLRKGHHVIGVDGFVGSTEDKLKIRNLKKAQWYRNFQLKRSNLIDMDWRGLLSNTDALFHLAGIPGVRKSWGEDFKPYLDYNILATQKLLEACKHASLKKLIYVSTSSVYGNTNGRTSEEHTPSPLSPYGVSKLTGEQLCHVYREAFGVPVVILRYFTVYGPRQRPDMAFHIFIRKLMKAEPLTVYGDGKQSRDFTFVGDCVAATASVLGKEKLIGETINIGGKERATVLEIIEMLEKITGIQASIEFQKEALGEPKHTWADIGKAQKLLRYDPKINLNDGLKLEADDLIALFRGN